MSQKTEILQLSPLMPVAQARLDAGFQPIRVDVSETGAAEQSAAFATIKAVITTGAVPIGQALLDQLPALELVSCTTAGYEAFDTEAMAARGVKLTNSAPALAEEVADLGILLMLAARRKLVAADAYVRSGDWAKHGAFPLQKTVTGKRLGIAGLGTIGLAIAKRAEVMGMEISYWGRSAKPHLPYTYEANLETLAKNCDILIAMMPGGDATRKIVSASVLQALGPDGLFINLARGSVVDEEALISALQDGSLGAAALDVYDNEPSPDPRFASLHNVVLAPHIGSATQETRDAMALIAVHNLEAHLAGKPLLSEIKL